MRTIDVILEGAAFAPVAITWIALSQALSASSDAAAGTTFLAGWANGFGDSTAWWALDKVAIVDGLIIASLGAIFIVVRLGAILHGSGSAPTAAESYALVTDGMMVATERSVAASEAAAQAANSVRDATEASRRDSATLSQQASQRALILENAANALTAAVAQATTLFEPLVAHQQRLEAIEDQLSRVAVAMEQAAGVGADVRQSAEQSLAAFRDAFDDFRGAFQSYAGEVRRQADAQTQLWERMALFTETSEQLMGRTLKISRDVATTATEFQHSVEQLRRNLGLAERGAR